MLSQYFAYLVLYQSLGVRRDCTSALLMNWAHEFSAITCLPPECLFQWTMGTLGGGHHETPREQKQVRETVLPIA